MPQPLRRAPKSISFNTDQLPNRPELATLLTAALAEWAKTEGALGFLFGAALEISYSRAASTLSSIVNFTARLEVVKTAATNAPISAELLEKVESLTLRLRARAGERNLLAHGIWAVSDEYPDKLLRCDASTAFAAIAKAIEEKGGEIHAVEPLTQHLMLWGKTCFLEATKRFFEIQVETITLSNEIVAALSEQRDRERKDGQPPD